MPNFRLPSPFESWHCRTENTNRRIIREIHSFDPLALITPGNGEVQSLLLRRRNLRFFLCWVLLLRRPVEIKREVRLPAVPRQQIGASAPVLQALSISTQP